MEHKALKNTNFIYKLKKINIEADCEHVVALLGLVLLLHVELAEEVEGDDGVDVDDDGEQHDGEDELLAVVGDGLQDGPQGLEAHGHVQQVGGEEEVVEVAQDGKDEVPERVEERVVGYRDARLPDLVAPVDVHNAGIGHLF